MTARLSFSLLVSFSLSLFVSSSRQTFNEWPGPG